MEELLNLINSEHPEYDLNSNKWDYLYRSFVGGDVYRKGEYLRRFLGEHLAPYDVYQARLDSTPFDNHCRTVIDVYRSFIFKTPPKREIGNLSANPFVEQWIEDTDLDGQGIDSFMKTAMDWAMVYGNVWIGVDKPAYNAATAGEELAAGIRAYANLYTPQNVRDFVYERDITGRMTLAYMRIVENAGETEDTLKLWTAENCRRIVAEKDAHTGEYKAILSMEEFENQLGYIPFVNLVPTPSQTKGFGHSQVEDVADISRSIYNKLSEIESNIRLSNAPSLVMTSETQAEAGPGGLVIMPEDLPGDKNPYLLQPTGSSIESILNTIANDIESIHRMTHLTAVQAKKTQAQSGVSMTVERQLLNSKLSDLADAVQEAETKLWKIFMDWQYIDAPKDFNIRYDKAYDIRDNKNDIDLLVKSMSVVGTVEYQEYVAVEVARMLIEDDDELAIVLKSIAAYDYAQAAVEGVNNDTDNEEDLQITGDWDLDHTTTETNTDADTGAAIQEENNTQGKQFSQEELNAIVDKRIKREQSKYSDINIEEYKELKAAKEKAETDKLMKRNEFDKILQQQKEKYDAENQSLRQKLEGIQVDGALMNAAVGQKAVNPQHISSLLKEQVKLDSEGNVFVLDGDGSVRYNQETAAPMTIDDLVSEFVSSNPYFKSAAPAGTGSVSNTANTKPTTTVGLEDLDLTKAEDRAVYRKMKQEGKIS